MKKILFVSDAWAPQINGAARVAQTHVKHLEKLGYAIEVVHPGQFFNVPLPFSPDIRLPLLPGRRMWRRIAAGGFDAVHIVAEGPLGFAARRACLRRGIPFTTWYHTRLDLYMGAYLAKLLVPVMTKLLRWFHGAAARTMVSTPTLKRLLEGEGFTNVVVVPLGVDTGRFVRNPVPGVPELLGPVFVYFSRLAPEKNPEEFLKLKLPGTKLVIGDGPLRKKLEKQYGSEAKFVGFKTGQELVDYLSCCDVMIFSSRTETFGLVTLEALACGVPVAAHQVMGPQDIITEGKDGYLSDDLADAAQKCLALAREDCRSKALQYSWEHSTQEFIKQLALIDK